MLDGYHIVCGLQGKNNNRQCLSVPYQILLQKVDEGYTCYINTLYHLDIEVVVCFYESVKAARLLFASFLEFVVSCDLQHGLIFTIL